MNLLRRLACLVFGHAPVVERQGDDSVLLCERCGHLAEVFVKGLYAKDGRPSRCAPFVEGKPDLRPNGPPNGDGRSAHTGRPKSATPA